VAPRSLTMFDEPAKTRWDGPVGIVHVPDPECRWCGQVTRIEMIQPAMFTHGGYGHGIRTRTAWCQCGAIRIGDTTPVNPKALA